jgi:hypothetical protein
MENRRTRSHIGHILFLEISLSKHITSDPAGQKV